MGIANSLRKCLVILEFVQFRGRLHVIELGHAAQRSREETQQIPHSHVVSCRRSARQSGHVCAADRRCRDGGKRRIAAYGARHAGDIDAGVVSQGVSPAQFAARLETVFAFRPTE